MIITALSAVICAECASCWCIKLIEFISGSNLFLVCSVDPLSSRERERVCCEATPRRFKLTRCMHLTRINNMQITAGREEFD